MLYEEKFAIANAYLNKHSGLTWNDFSDVNSLHDCDSQEDIFDACNIRLEEGGYPMDLIEENNQASKTKPEDTEEPEKEDEEDDSDIAFYED
jgi:hypothetical protein